MDFKKITLVEISTERNGLIKGGKGFRVRWRGFMMKGPTPRKGRRVISMEKKAIFSTMLLMIRYMMRPSWSSMMI